MTIINSSLTDSDLVHIARIASKDMDNPDAYLAFDGDIPIPILRAIADSAANQAYFDRENYFDEFDKKYLISKSKSKNDKIFYWMITTAWALCVIYLIYGIFFK